MPRILNSSKYYVIYVHLLYSIQFVQHILINRSSATGRVSWINSEQSNVSWTIREKFFDDEDADSSQNACFFPILPPHMAGSPKQISCTLSPCKFQIIQILFYYKRMWTDSSDLTHKQILTLKLLHFKGN
jgi:hypothetical protein